MDSSSEFSDPLDEAISDLEDEGLYTSSRFRLDPSWFPGSRRRTSPSFFGRAIRESSYPGDYACGQHGGADCWGETFFPEFFGQRASCDHCLLPYCVACFGGACPQCFAWKVSGLDLALASPYPNKRINNEILIIVALGYALRRSFYKFHPEVYTSQYIPPGMKSMIC